MSGGAWFVEAFGRHYLEVYAHRDDAAATAEVEFARRALRLGRGARVLDLACGAGRHARAFDAAGCRVAGLDLSADLLDAAAARGGGPRLVRGDMRRLPFPSAFDAVCLFFTSFGYFDDPAEDRRVLGEAARVLAPRGGLLLDAAHRDRVVATLVPRSEERRGGNHVLQERRITPDGFRVEKHVRMTDGAGRVLADYLESVRLYAPAEIEAMLAGAGFAPEARYGDLSGSPFGPTSPRFVAVARRRTC